MTFMSGESELGSAFAEYLGRKLSADLANDRPAWDDKRVEAAARELSELSFTSVLVAEEHGGLGLGALDLVAMFTEAGRQLLPLPLVDRGALALSRSGDDLVVTVGDTRRRIALPSVLRRCTTAGARFDSGCLIVDYVADPALWPATLQLVDAG